ncbi:hypothetical protein N9W60_06160 [Flavobacteriaceae bacterium]|nr:hypothetical protein [Flavobacteriaceae bacterium]MDC3365431.1 hypothetical protein [Pseudomonadales bacterium]
MASRQARNWCFTINNYNAHDIESLKQYSTEKCTYMCYGTEIGESGTPHVQGYMELRQSRTRRSSITKFFNDKRCTLPHLEVRKGTAIQAKEYCKKEMHLPHGSFVEFGEIRERRPSADGQGKRTDIEVVRERINSGDIVSEMDLLNTVTSMAAYRFGTVYLNAIPRPATRTPPSVFWLYGSTGTGKSKASAEFVTKLSDKGWSYWRANQGLAWFDGYNRQEIAWFDDFRFSGSQSDYALLLNLTDRYPLRVPVKGGFTIWEPKLIIFTGPLSIQSQFNALPESDNVDQFMRRITGEYNYNGDGKRQFNESIIRFMEPLDE